MYGQKMSLYKTAVNFTAAEDDNMIKSMEGDIKIDLAKTNAASFNFYDSLSSAVMTP